MSSLAGTQNPLKLSLVSINSVKLSLKSFADSLLPLNLIVVKTGIVVREGTTLYNVLIASFNCCVLSIV